MKMQGHPLSVSPTSSQECGGALGTENNNRPSPWEQKTRLITVQVDSCPDDVLSLSVMMYFRYVSCYITRAEFSLTSTLATECRQR